MTAGEAFHAAIQQAKGRIAPQARVASLAEHYTLPSDSEIDCRECAGSGLSGPSELDPPCFYCSGSGVWTCKP